MEKHTPEPWQSFQSHTGFFHVVDSTAQTVLADLVPRGVGAAGNARRIVAAVNACDGIPTEHLQPGAVKRLTLAVAALDAILFPGDGGRDPEDTDRMRQQLVNDLAEAMERHGWAGDAEENRGFIADASKHAVGVAVPSEVAQTAEGALVVAKAQMRTFAQTWERQGLSDAAAWAKKQAGAFAKAHRSLAALLHPAEGGTTHDGESR